MGPAPHLQLIDDAGVEELGRPAVVAPGARVVALDACEDRVLGQASAPTPYCTLELPWLMHLQACFCPAHASSLPTKAWSMGRSTCIQIFHIQMVYGMLLLQEAAPVPRLSSQFHTLSM